MPAKELIVLIVRDVALRSALIARLSLEGESLVTLNADPLDPLVARVAARPTILVIDTHTLDGRLERLHATDRWERIIILGDSADGVDTGRACLIDPGKGILAVGHELARWRLERAS
jgi:hypothetical protein